MKEEIELIKKYAQNSINFGTKNRNKFAVERGNEVALAINKLETYIDILEHQVSDRELLDNLNAHLMREMVNKVEEDF
jgi:hypothetical protein